jgi:hypothetical protein
MKNEKQKISAIVFCLVIISLALSLPVMTFADTIQLPKTGQNQCYDSDGNSISCSGTGQDGDIQAGVAWPSPRFTDNGDGTVTDNLTGLMWIKDETKTMSWQEALNYAKTLSTGGYTDWRLPNVNELESLLNDGEPNNAAWLNSQGFANVQPDFYWSSTTLGETANAWGVNFDSGSVSHSVKASKNYVHALRAGQSASTTTTTIQLTTTTIQTTTTSEPDTGIKPSLVYDCDCIIYDTDSGETVASKAQIGFSINFIFTSSYIYVEQYAGGVIGTSSIKIGPFFKMTRSDKGVSITGTALPFRLRAEGVFIGYRIVCDGDRVWQ